MVIWDAVVIGNGIMGATISAALRIRGLSVLTLDSKRDMAGTPASGGHIKPSWLGMAEAEYKPALDTLEAIWGLYKEEYAIRPNGGKELVYRVDTARVLASTATEAKVTRLDKLDGCPLVLTEVGMYRGRLLVIAAGVWTKELFPDLELTAKQGVSFSFQGTLPEPFIQQWAPYKQIVAHQQAAGEIWAGDGSAILPANWTTARTGDCLRRCRVALGDCAVASRTFGLRPYTKAQAAGEPCLLRRLYPSVWVATGAGKSGTIAAGWAARKIVASLDEKTPAG